MILTRQNFTAQFELAAKACAIATIFFIPLSNSLTTIFSLLCLVCSVLSFDKQKISYLLQHPLTKCVLLMLACYLVGIVYTVGTSADVLQALRKSGRLLYIPILLLLFNKAQWRQHAVFAYVAGVFVMVAAKIGIEPLLFKDSIFTSLFIVYALFILGHLSFDNTSSRWFTIPSMLMFTYYLMFINVGRTGQVLLFLLYALFCWQRFGFNFKKQAIAILCLAALVTVTIMIPSSFSRRQAIAATEVQNFLRNSTAPIAESSMGLRMTFAQNAMQLVKLKPIFGWGTGGFPQAYAQTFPDSFNNSTNTVNPHNQYLLTTVELGLVGIACLIYLFLRLFYEFWISKDHNAKLGVGLVVAVGIGCLANSWLLDFASMYMFVVLAGVLAGACIDSKQVLS
jgi:O-antigen ligase